MYTLFIILTVVASVLLILVVLAQNPKGGGLSSQFGGSGTSQLMGVKRTGDFLEKTTWVLSVIIVILCLSSFVFMKNTMRQGPASTPALEKAGEQQNFMPPPANEQGDPLGIEMDSTSGGNNGGAGNNEPLPEGLEGLDE